ncbi:plasmid mobilization protein [Paraburkholderia megapolitana]|uniref:plasmid mobilization protein n=1 Tax=Paraburkholderia megapolitana TaxID=420953 RepID=UPI0038B81A6E
MNKPTERIVVFVTPAQKRAIAASAEGLGISVSELMRRAVLSFGATSEQVKAASIVDRLNAPREPDALNEALQRVARTATKQRTAPRAATKAAPVVEPRDTSDPSSVGAPFGEHHGTPLSVPDALRAHHDALAATAAAVAAAAGALDAPITDTSAEDLQAAAEAAARVTAAKAASLAANAAKAPRTRRAASSEEDDSHPDPATPDGHFA